MLVLQLNPTSKYNQNYTPGRLQNPRIELMDFSISKISLGKNCYEVHHYNDPTSGKRKYKGSELYLFSTVIFPRKLIDNMDKKPQLLKRPHCVTTSEIFKHSII